MAIDGINGLIASSAFNATNATPGAASADADAFTDALSKAIENTSQQMDRADTYAQALAAGEPVSLHDTMLAVEKADLSVRTFVSVKSKAIDAYKEIMRMQM